MAGLANGAVVLIQGLQSRPDLNGQAAKVLNFDRAAGRFEVELLGGKDKGTRVKPKAANLKPLQAPPLKRPSDIAMEAAAAVAAEREEAERAAKRQKTGEEAAAAGAASPPAESKEDKPHPLAKLLSDDTPGGIEAGAIFIAKMRTPIYKSAQSWDMIRWLSAGDQVVADGPPIDAEGYEMLPVRPMGAIEFEHLVAKKGVRVSKILAEFTKNPPIFKENWEKWKAEEKMRIDVYNEIRDEFEVGDQYELGCGVALYGKEWGGATTGSIPAQTPSGRHQVIQIMEHGERRMKVQGTYWDREGGKLVLAHWLVGWMDPAMACDKLSGELLMRKSTQDRAERKQWTPRPKPKAEPVEARAPRVEVAEAKKEEGDAAAPAEAAEKKPEKKPEADGEDDGPPRLEKVEKMESEAY